MKITPRRLRFLLNCYGPYLGAGVRVTHIARDWRELRVTMKRHWYNRNAVGTHFGGSLYSMIDPHCMLLLMNLLGKDYVVWDKAAQIEFIRAVKGPVHATIRISEEDVRAIRERTRDGGKFMPEFTIEITDDDDVPVATVRKVLYVRRKK
jgi:acyl-coenzyme A thioesterase PaaI-like protein